MFLNNKSLLFACSLAVSTSALFAQDLPDQDVDIIKDFDARLLDANKLNVTPTLPALDTTTQRQNYLVPPRPLNITYDAPRLRPLGMRSAGKTETYNGYVKAGAGIPASFLAEGGYYFGNTEDRSEDETAFDGKLWVRHHSANFRDLDNQRFFNNDARLNGNVYLANNLAVEGNIGYSYDRVHYYGYDHDSLEFGASKVRQDFKIFELGGRVYNTERTEADFSFSVAPKFYLLNDYYSNRETGFDLRLAATKWFAEKHPLRFAIRTDFTSFTDDDPQSLNNIYLQPSFTYHADVVRIKLGGNFASNRDIFYVFPDIELNLRIFGDGLQIFGGLDGDLRKNNYRNASEYNPWVDIRQTSRLRNTVWRNYFGGIRGDLGFLSYTAQAGYSTADNLALYQTFFTADKITQFQMIYDTAQIFNVQGTLKLQPFKELTVLATLSQNLYTLEREVGHWGLPELEGNFSAIYSVLEGQANLRANAYFADRIAFRNLEGRIVEGSSLFDLGVGGSYYFTKNIGVFLDVNNLLNNKRERWHNYPMYGLNVLGGITARF